MNFKIKTPKELEAFAKTPANIEMMKGLFLALAMEETIRPVIKAKQKELVMAREYYPSEELIKLGIPKERITDADKMYMASNEDCDAFYGAYDDYLAGEAAEFRPRKQGNCPLLEAESLTRQLKRQIGSHFAPQLGIDYDNITMLEDLDKFWNIMLGLFAAHIKEKQAA